MYLNVYTEIYVMIFPDRITFWIITRTGANLEDMAACLHPLQTERLNINLNILESIQLILYSVCAIQVYFIITD